MQPIVVPPEGNQIDDPQPEITNVPTLSAIALAAQADLVLLTVEMLRAPQAVLHSQSSAWFQMPLDELRPLLDLALESTNDIAGEPKGPSSEVASQGQASNSLNLFASLTDLPPPEVALQEVYELARALDFDAWSDEYCRLFDSSQDCPLNQAAYIRRDKGTILGDVCGFYNAFGWKRNPDKGQRPDHLLCQLEFVGLMLAMAARADEQEKQQIVLEALAEFARLHMHDWLPSVCGQLVGTTQLAYFGAVAQWLLTFWRALTHSNRWPLDRVDPPPLAPVLDPEDPYECGAPDLVNIKPVSPEVFPLVNR